MKNMNQAKAFLFENDATCVVVKNGNTYYSNEKGIKPLMEWLKQDKDFLQNAFVADKVIGKAAAMIMIYGGVKAIYGSLVSEHTVSFLENSGVEFYFDKNVPYILNRTQTDMCPMEKRCIDLDSAFEAFEVLSSQYGKFTKGEES